MQKEKTRKPKKRKLLTPKERAKEQRKKDEAKREAARYQFPKGNGPDEDDKGHHGKIVKCEDLLSEIQLKPMWVLTAGTYEKRTDGKKVDIRFRYLKSDEALVYLYVMLEKAGADIGSIPPREENEDLHDKMVNIFLDELENVNARIRFHCAHKLKDLEAGKQNPKLNINFYINTFDEINGELPLVGILPQEEEEEEEEKEEEEKKDDKGIKFFKKFGFGR